jgi:hypothetical protein
VSLTAILQSAFLLLVIAGYGTLAIVVLSRGLYAVAVGVIQMKISCHVDSQSKTTREDLGISLNRPMTSMVVDDYHYGGMHKSGQ